MNEKKLKEKVISKDLYLLGLKVFWRTVSNFKWLVVVIFVLAVATSVFSTWGRFLAGSFIEKLTLNDQRQAMFVAAILIITGLVNVVLTWSRQYQQTKLNAWSERYYQSELHQKVIRISAEFIKKKNSGGLISIINRGANAIFNIGAGLLFRLVEPVITGVVAVVSIFTIAPQFGLVSLVSVVLYIIVVAVMNPRAVKAQRGFRDITKDFSEYIHDVIANLFALKHTSHEQEESRKINDWYDNIEEKGDEHRKSWNDMDFWQNLIRVGTEAGFRIVGVFLVFETKDLSVGEMVTVMGLYISIFRPVDIIATNWRSVVNSLIDLEASEELYNEPEEDYNESGTTISDREQLQPLVIKQLSFSYPDAPEVPVLKDITLTINPCEVIALVSTSGGGKSTLFDLLYRLYEPTSGSIEYGDTLISDFKLSDYRKQFAIVPQDISLFNTTLKQNIVYGSEHITDDQLVKVLRETSMDGFVGKLPEGLDTIVGDKGMKLSGGQKQRVAICRAFLRSPKILLMDEPTSALDAETESVIQKALLDLFVGKTVIVAAHRLATIKRADRIVVLKEGEIVEIGTHDQLMSKKKSEYKKLYELQVGLY